MKKVPQFLFLLVFFAACIQSNVTADTQLVENKNIISLDGKWQIIFDEKNEGVNKRWFSDKEFQADTQIQFIEVPSCWETIKKDYEGVAFYRRMFKVDPSWKGKVVRLQFDAVNFIAEVWLNGVALGKHEGGFTPFEFLVDDLLKFDKLNTLILRVSGPILMTDKRIDGIGKFETPQWRGAITGGIWQPVRMVSTDKVFIDDVFIKPQISNNTVTFDLELENTAVPAVNMEVKTAIFSNGRVVAEETGHLELKPGGNKISFMLDIPDAVYWSPDNPHLYTAEVRVNIDGKESDIWKSRFGMREFTVRDNQFYLNGEPFYLKATFFEGLYPVGLAYPDNREMAIREIQLAKDAGFNMIRPWRKPPPPMWLDLCDEMGVLTIGSLAVECMGFPRQSANLPHWVENEVRESIIRDRNRTCVVQWELFNELKQRALKRMMHQMSLLARELDPTRLILDESGGHANGARLYFPYSMEPVRFNDIHDYPGPHISEEVYRELTLTGIKTHEEMRDLGLTGHLPGKNVQPGLMTYFSELGYGSLPDLVENNLRFAKKGNSIVPPTVYHRRLADNYRAVLRKSGFDRIYPDLQQFCLDEQLVHGRANKLQIEAVRCNPNVIGYCIHALTGGDWIMGAGLIDLWRNPKSYAYEGTKAANQSRIVPVRVFPRNVYAEQGTSIEVTGVNEWGVLKGQLLLEVVGPDGQLVFSEKKNVKMDRGITPLYEHRLDTDGLKGTYLVKVKISNGKEELVAENEYAFDVFAADQLILPGEKITVHDPWNILKPFLKRQGIGFEEFNDKSDMAIPVFVSRTEANTKEDREWFARLEAFAGRGGTVVYLGGGGSVERELWAQTVELPEVLPVKGKLKRAHGPWVPITHLVHAHPIFDGLPVNAMMGPIYENVWAQLSLVGIGGELVAGCISFDWYPDLDKNHRHYYGPGDTWYGSDVAIVPVGQGRCILSQLRLVDFLGKDPVADLILYNMIRYAASLEKRMKP